MTSAKDLKRIAFMLDQEPISKSELIRAIQVLIDNEVERLRDTCADENGVLFANHYWTTVDSGPLEGNYACSRCGGSRS